MKSLNQRWIAAALVGATCLLATTTTHAAQFILRAAATTKTMPDGRVVPMWGFAQDAVIGVPNGTVTSPGPALLLGAGDSVLRIVLTNTLAEGVSLVIPGLPPPTVRLGNQNGPLLGGHSRTSLPSDVDLDNAPLGNFPGPEDVDNNSNGVLDVSRDRARSFVAETPPNNVLPGSATPRAVVYIWDNVPPGTYLYHSGSHPALQVQMGLHGALRRRAGSGEVYGEVPYNQNLDLTLLFSEVDADLHDAVAAGNYGPGKLLPSTIHSDPQYYLINGKAYNPADPAASITALPARPTAARPALLRFLNAGQDMRVPIIDRSQWTIIAQDARTNSTPRTQYSIQLPALKTVDALWAQNTPGTFALYDRRLGLSNGTNLSGGMMLHLRVP